MPLTRRFIQAVQQVIRRGRALVSRDAQSRPDGISRKSVDDQLITAVFEEDLDRVRDLLECGADVNCVGSLGSTPLMQAAEMESIEVARYLLEQGSKINQKGHEGYSPLHIAIDVSIDAAVQDGGQENLEMIEFFLAAGADRFLKNDSGATPIDIARGYGSRRVVRLLEHYDP